MLIYRLYNNFNKKLTSNWRDNSWNHFDVSIQQRFYIRLDSIQVSASVVLCTYIQFMNKTTFVKKKNPQCQCTFIHCALGQSWHSPHLLVAGYGCDSAFHHSHHALMMTTRMTSIAIAIGRLYWESVPAVGFPSLDCVDEWTTTLCGFS